MENKQTPWTIRITSESGHFHDDTSRLFYNYDDAIAWIRSVPWANYENPRPMQLQTIARN